MTKTLASTDGQAVLELDFGAIDPDHQHVNLNKIDFETTGAENRTTGSVALFGWLTVPLLQRLDNGRFRIIDGRRRLESARDAVAKINRQLPEEGVSRDDPAYEYNVALADQADKLLNPMCAVTDYDGRIVLAMAAVALNYGRTMNPLSEARYFATLIQEGLSVEQIVAAAPPGTRMTKRQVASRLQLLKAPKKILTALEEGKVKPTVALAISRLDKAHKKEVVAALGQFGKVTHAHLKDIRQARRSQNNAMLPSSLFARPGEPTPSERMATALANVEHAVAAALRIPDVRKEDLRTIITNATREV